MKLLVDKIWRLQYANIDVFIPYNEASKHVAKNAIHSSDELVSVNDRPDNNEVHAEAVKNGQ